MKIKITLSCKSTGAALMRNYDLEEAKRIVAIMTGEAIPACLMPHNLPLVQQVEGPNGDLFSLSVDVWKRAEVAA